MVLDITNSNMLTSSATPSTEIPMSSLSLNSAGLASSTSPSMISPRVETIQKSPLYFRSVQPSNSISDTVYHSNLNKSIPDTFEKKSK